MSIRLNNRSSSHTSIRQSPRPSCSKLDSQPPTSKSGTYSGSRTRSHEPKPRPSTHMESPTPTPTPRKPRRHNKGSLKPEQRDPVPALLPDDESDPDSSTDDELIVLLDTIKHDIIGSDTPVLDLPDEPKKGGILAISKADIAESRKGRRGGKKVMADDELGGKLSQSERRTPGRRGVKKTHAVEKGFDVTESVTDPSSQGAGTPTRKGRNSAAPKPSGLASTLAAHKSVRSSTKVDNSDLIHFDTNAEVYDMSPLSRSLPGHDDSFLGNVDKHRSRKKREPKSDNREMPTKLGMEVPNSHQHLPSRASERKLRKAPSVFQPSATKLASSRPEHERRKSTDGLPVVSHPHPPRSAPPLRPAVFDQDGSYHIGHNVDRPPQTPSKIDLRETLSSAPLPLISGGFPRINNKVFDNVLNSGMRSHPHTQSQSAPGPDGIVYAGALNQSSPHARGLAKPELDDDF